MSLMAAVKAMAQRYSVMDQLDKEDFRLALIMIELELLRKKEKDIKEDIIYHEIKRLERYVMEGEQKITELKAELAAARSQFFTKEEIAELKSDGVLATLLTQLERAEAHKMHMMLKENGADFITEVAWNVKDKFW